MKIDTFHFGEIEVGEQDMFTFSKGMPGFEGFRDFVVIKLSDMAPFSYLQSIEKKELSFIITDPFLFYPDYEFELTERMLEELLVERKEDVMVWSIVTVQDELNEATLNLLAPVVLNLDKRLGKQIVLHDTGYKTKHKLIENKNQKKQKV